MRVHIIRVTYFIIHASCDYTLVVGGAASDTHTAMVGQEYTGSPPQTTLSTGSFIHAYRSQPSSAWLPLESNTNVDLIRARFDVQRNVRLYTSEQRPNAHSKIITYHQGYPLRLSRSKALHPSLWYHMYRMKGRGSGTWESMSYMDFPIAFILLISLSPWPFLCGEA